VATALGASVQPLTASKSRMAIMTKIRKPSDSVTVSSVQEREAALPSLMVLAALWWVA